MIYVLHNIFGIGVVILNIFIKNVETISVKCANLMNRRFVGTYNAFYSGDWAATAALCITGRLSQTQQTNKATSDINSQEKQIFF